MRRRLALAAGVAAALALAAQSCSRPRTAAASLRVEARTERGPLAGAALYLLDEDLIRLAMAEDGGDPLRRAVHREHPRLRLLAGLLNGRRFSAYRLGPDVRVLLEQSRPLWEPHVVAAARADDAGRAHFDGLAPGVYWLMCLDERGGRVAFWNLWLPLERGAGGVTLDGRNALTVNDAGPAR